MNTKTLALLGLGIGILLPAVAVAQSPAESPEPVAKGRRAKANFPMSGPAFSSRVDQRLAAMRARLVKRLDKRQVPAAQKQRVLATFDGKAAAIKQAAARAASDGTVTRKEAKQVRKKAKAMRSGKGRRGGKAKRGKKNFPLKGATFSKNVDQRIAKARARLQRRLAKSKLSAAKKRAIVQDFQKSAAALRASAKTAAVDGKVTRKEAKQVRQLARRMASKMRNKHGLKGKGKKRRKGRRGRRKA
jgi:hypothetical protein